MTKNQIVPKDELPPTKGVKYTEQLKEYVTHTLTEPEQQIYKTFFNEIKEKNQLQDAEDLMMLDIVVHNFIRIKRLQILVHAEGESFQYVMKNGEAARKVHDHAHLLNAIETQFRNSLKELGMSRKEKKKGFVEKANKDFSSIFADKEVIEVKQDAEGNKSIKATK